MMSIRTFVILLSATIVLACNKYDDSQLWSKLEEHESRITKLEKLCRELNNNISALQTLVVALQNNDYVTSVIPIIEYGQEVGYSIRFSNGDIAKIYHGKDGKDGSNGENGADGKDGKDGENGRDGKDGLNGSTPVIGVAQDSDGVYYWTIDGQWLLDNEGNKLRVTGENGRDGTDGKDGRDGVDGRDGTDGQNGKQGANGMMPLLRVIDGLWYMSFDNGFSWDSSGTPANGKDGKDGKDGEDGKDGVNGLDGKDADCMFSSIEMGDNVITIALTNGTVFCLPYQNYSQPISFQKEGIEVINRISTIIPIDINIDFELIDGIIANISTNGLIATKSVDDWGIEYELSEDKTQLIVRINPQRYCTTKAANLQVHCVFLDGSSYTISKTIKISEYRGYDLSTEGAAGCYIVSESGYYKFPMVSVYNTKIYDSYMKDFSHIAVIDGEELISNMDYIDGCIWFDASEKKGNVLVAAVNKNNAIIYAWHIWLTDKPKDQVYNNGAGIMMDRNLGATSAVPGNENAFGILFSNNDRIYAIKEPYKINIDIFGGFNCWADHLCPAGYMLPESGFWETAFGPSSPTRYKHNYQFYDNGEVGFNLGYTDNKEYRYLTDEPDCWYPFAYADRDRYYANYWSHPYSNGYFELELNKNGRNYATIKDYSSKPEKGFVRCIKK